MTTATELLISIEQQLLDLSKQVRDPSLLPYFQSIEQTSKLILLQQQFDAFSARVSNLVNSVVVDDDNFDGDR